MTLTKVTLFITALRFSSSLVYATLTSLWFMQEHYNNASDILVQLLITTIHISSLLPKAV